MDETEATAYAAIIPLSVDTDNKTMNMLHLAAQV